MIGYGSWREPFYVAYFVINDNIVLDQNDYVKIQVANVSDTSDVTAEFDSYFLVEAR